MFERELDLTENILRDSFANVARVSGSSDDVHVRSFIASLKIKTRNYEVANHPLVTRRKQTGHVHEAEQLVESRLNIVHPDSYEAVKLLNSRLVVLGPSDVPVCMFLIHRRTGSHETTIIWSEIRGNQCATIPVVSLEQI